MSSPETPLNSQAQATAPSTLFSGPSPPNCTSTSLNFAKHGLPEYANSFVLSICNLLTPEECTECVAAASATTNDIWEQAMVNVGGGRQALSIESRNCGRIIWDSREIAARVLERIMPHMPEEIVFLKDSPSITGNGPAKRKETWRLSRLNERMRFLKYTSGMYFREHCDGNYRTEDGKEISFLTAHLYLNGDIPSPDAIDDRIMAPNKDDRPLTGGATRFFSWNMKNYVDIAPVAGSCVIFQQRDMLHSGDDVIQGTKYTMRTDVMYEKMVEA